MSLTYDPAVKFIDIYTRDMEMYVLKKDLRKQVHSSLVHNSQKLE